MDEVDDRDLVNVACETLVQEDPERAMDILAILMWYADQSGLILSAGQTADDTLQELADLNTSTLEHLSTAFDANKRKRIYH